MRFLKWTFTLEGQCIFFLRYSMFVMLFFMNEIHWEKEFRNGPLIESSHPQINVYQKQNKFRYYILTFALLLYSSISLVESMVKIFAWSQNRNNSLYWYSLTLYSFPKNSKIFLYWLQPPFQGIMQYLMLEENRKANVK